MFTVESQQQQYLTYVLTDTEAGSQVEVVPERGGIVTRWRIQDREVFYLDQERYQDPTLTVRGGIPILFPICGNMPENTYHVNGTAYTLKQHGFARDLPWQVVGQETDGQASVAVKLVSTEATLKVYPFEFEVVYHYQLQGNTLTVRQFYRNLSSDPMPFVAGFHPYFAVQDKSQLTFSIPGQRYWDHRALRHQPYSGQFDFDSDEIDVAFTELADGSAQVMDAGTGSRLTLRYESQFSTLVFWTVKGKPFYCLEPWTAPRNAMNSGDHLLKLDPGTTLETAFSLTVD